MAEHGSPLESINLISQRLEQLDGTFNWGIEIEQIRTALSHAEGETQPAAMLRDDLRQLYVDMLNADVHAETAGESFGLGRCITASHLERFAALLETGVVPSEHGENRYGLDMAYFRNAINRELNRPLTYYRPDELARVFARLSRTADPAVMREPEFTHPAPQVPVPEGWKLVPIKPTDKMIIELMCTGLRHAEYKDGCSPKVSEMAQGYEIMLAAAPTVTAGEPCQGDVEIPGDDGLDIHTLEQPVSDPDGRLRAGKEDRT